MKKINCFVPAKINSRRLPNKNMRQLGGQPLFAHSVNVAASCAQVSNVYVSSQCEDVLHHAVSLDALPLKRQEALCKDYVTNFMVLEHHHHELTTQRAESDIILLLQPTSPFRTSEALENMISYFYSKPDLAALVTTIKIKRSIGSIKKGIWSKKPLGEEAYFAEFTGHAVLLRPHLSGFDSPLNGPFVGAYELPTSWPDIDIDTEQDFFLGENRQNLYIKILIGF